jgi:2-polyprenyl-6-methoxyphenol hydroxylase-like FAD-dependent oxidoreductase
MDALSRVLPHYGVVVIGARCAGAATAMLLARAGMRVLAVDRQAYGSDTISTHALMRTAVVQLDRWGLLPVVMEAGTPEIRSTTFHYGHEAIRVAIKPEHGIDYLCAPRRTVIDRILVDAASDAGADLRHGVSLSDLLFDKSRRVVGVRLKDGNGTCMEVRADIVIGADGRQSTVAKLVDAETYLTGTSATGVVFGYFENLDREGSHWHFGEDVAAGVVPTNHGQHCVFAVVPGPSFAATIRGDVESAFYRILDANSPQLGDDVRRARLIGRLRGYAGIPGHLRQPHGSGWALVGDAGYYKDPLTAHGITDALRDAELLARAILDGRPGALETYQQQRDALSLPLFHVTESIASFRWSLDDAKALHSRLSAAMRAEGDHMAGLPASNPLAA